MAEVTAQWVAGAVDDSTTPALGTAIARALPPLRPLGPGDAELTVESQTEPTRFDMLAGHDVVGSLLVADWPYATAVCPHAVWRLTSRRRGMISRIGIAEDALTRDAVAAYYPSLLPGGTLALHDTHFRLTLPWTTSGWRLLDEDGQRVARIERRDPSECRTGRCMLVGRSVKLEQPPGERHPDLALVLLTAVWLVRTATLQPPVMS